MKVDINVVLSGQEYERRVGQEYELSPGNWGRMKIPTQELQEKALSAAQEDEQDDLSLARLVLDGLKPFEDDQQIVGMASVVVADFFSIVIGIGRMLMQLSGQYEQSPDQESPQGS